MLSALPSGALRAALAIRMKDRYLSRANPAPRTAVMVISPAARYTAATHRCTIQISKRVSVGEVGSPLGSLRKVYKTNPRNERRASSIDSLTVTYMFSHSNTMHPANSSGERVHDYNVGQGGHTNKCEVSEHSISN